MLTTQAQPPSLAALTIKLNYQGLEQQNRANQVWTNQLTVPTGVL